MKYYPKSQIQTGLTSQKGEFKLLNSRGGVSVKTLKNKITNDFYVGNYFKTSDGKFFTGNGPNDPEGVFELQPLKEMVISEGGGLYSKEEIPSERRNTKINQNIELNSTTSFYVGDDVYNVLRKKQTNQNAPLPPKSSFPEIKEDDYIKGETFRYFAKHKINNNIIEISNSEYNFIKNRDSKIQYELYKTIQIRWKLNDLKGDLVKFNYNQVKIAEGLGFEGLGSFLRNDYSKIIF